MKKSFESNMLLRKAFIRVLKATAFDFNMTNPWSKKQFYLNSYLHKGYWYYRDNRERETMLLFKKYIKPEDRVIEIGGHIGWITQFFSTLVPMGNVIVFEPGSNNVRYLNKNISALPNVRHIEMAVSNFCGSAEFYEDDITGQNNSLLSDYKNVEFVQKSHGILATKTVKKVRVTTLDEYLNGVRADFIKIDIEGNELNALKGARATLAKAKGLMVEVTENQKQCSDFLNELGFALFNEAGSKMAKISPDFNGNVFAIRDI